MTKNISFIKRFLEPAFLDKRSTLKIFLHGLNESFLVLTLPMIFVPKISTYLFSGDMQSAAKISILALSLFFVLYLLKAKYMYYWYWAMNTPFQKTLYEKHIFNLIRIDPTIFENNGTGYFLSKFENGIKAHSSMNREMIENIPQVIMNISVSVFLSFLIGFYYGLVLSFIILTASVLIFFFYKKELELIYPSVELDTKTSGDISRIIMSRQEILHSRKTDAEIKNILNLQSQIYEMEKNTFKYSIRRMSPIWIFPFFSTLLLFSLQSFGHINLNLYQLTSAIFILNVLGYIFSHLFRIAGSIFENYKNVKTFWEMIDQPKLKGYDIGEEFVHKGGEIELRDIDFTYDANIKNEIK